MRPVFETQSDRRINRRLSGRGPAVFLGLALAGFAAAAAASNEYSEEPPVIRASTNANANASEPLRCEIGLDAVAGGTRFEGRVISATAVQGTYALAITSRSSGGRATIRQSGDFAAAAGVPVVLGETELYGSPASHSVDLEIRVGGRRLTCANPAL